MLKLKNYFDLVTLLNLSSRQDRLIAMQNQFDQVGIDYNDINVVYATPFPYNSLIADAFNRSGKGRFTKCNEYDCSRNHYGIVKSAYDRGLNHILVMEDDIRFIKDISCFETLLENLPNDYDIIQFGGFSADPKITKYLSNSKNAKFVKHSDTGMWNCSMYALSRKGMEFYIAFMDKFFWVADGPLFKAPLNEKIVNTYMTSSPIVIQADKDIVASDIRDESNDNIDYKNQNLYESKIRKDDFFDFVMKPIKK